MALPARILDRVPPEHRHLLSIPVSDAANGAMRTLLTAGLLKPVMPDHVVHEIVTSGYARKTSGGTVVLSDLGQIRALVDMGR